MAAIPVDRDGNSVYLAAGNLVFGLSC